MPLSARVRGIQARVGVTTSSQGSLKTVQFLHLRGEGGDLDALSRIWKTLGQLVLERIQEASVFGCR